MFPLYVYVYISWMDPTDIPASDPTIPSSPYGLTIAPHSNADSLEVTDYSVQNLSLCILVLGCILLGYLRFYTEYVHIRLRAQHPAIRNDDEPLIPEERNEIHVLDEPPYTEHETDSMDSTESSLSIVGERYRTYSSSAAGHGII